ncbi:MAG: hypothetical protein AAB150_06935 [Pseudomonadota bacterium]
MNLPNENAVSPDGVPMWVTGGAHTSTSLREGAGFRYAECASGEGNCIGCRSR